ncbi:capsule biosynthesis protein [Azotobacter chroococcum]|uniref:Capsule biosynthesis protein n=1 Tax=Azotobacter chroococcum TaxID=353 RepID=A0AAP9YF09_9GAMM|nr:capsule biosynthesis protein [Azotobacter chroococcum]QQE89466.1 capsule biosynthesis protein [Azotobacter chroococcum]
MAEPVRIDPPAEGAWARKARMLDRYRWRVLRERHAWPGAALRFGREALLDLIFGIRAHLGLSKASRESESCDFLLLQGAPKVIPLQRKKHLIAALRGAGHHLLEIAQEDPQAVIAGHLLARPPQPVPLRYFGYAAYAEWLVERYDPRLLINDRNGSLCSPFLRLSLNRRGRPLVHLAHATTLESSRRLGMTDYDYYFLFGQSSLDALRERPLRFGGTQAVLSGSHMVDRAYDLPPAEAALRTLLILGVGPDKEKEAGYRRTYALLRDWAADNPHYRVLVKAHPRSQVPFWQEAAAQHAHIEVLPAGCSLAEALGRASVVVNIMSNAVVEAALARRPVIYVNAGDDRDIFAQERFFGGRIDSLSALTQRVAWIEGHYLPSLEKAREFAEYHLTHGVRGLEQTTELLGRLLGGEDVPGQPLGGSVS